MNVWGGECLGGERLTIDNDDKGIDGRECGGVTYEVVDGSDSQKPGRIISHLDIKEEFDLTLAMKKNIIIIDGGIRFNIRYPHLYIAGSMMITILCDESW